MFLRIDRLQIELPQPKDASPDSAAAVQELLGGRFGEMSTLMNYMYQSFNFRGRDQLKPYYDLIANIAAEELGHIELVAATINLLLTNSTEPGDRPMPRWRRASTVATPTTSSPPGRRPSAPTRWAVHGGAITSSPAAI
jgi:Mn-containing catalase